MATGSWGIDTLTIVRVNLIRESPRPLSCKVDSTEPDQSSGRPGGWVGRHHLARCILDPTVRISPRPPTQKDRAFGGRCCSAVLHALVRTACREQDDDFLMNENAPRPRQASAECSREYLLIPCWWQNCYPIGS